MALTDVMLRGIKPDGKRRRIYDTAGLYLEVAASGSRTWRLKYRHGGKERVLKVGAYPQIGLKEARGKRDAARVDLDNGIDPNDARAVSITHDSTTFQAVALQWFEGMSETWAPRHAKRVGERLAADIYPYMGQSQIDTIEAPELLAVLRKVEARGSIETAHRLRRTCGQVFRYAIATGTAKRNPAADLTGALKPYKNGHFAAVTDPVRLGAVLRTLHAYTGTLPVRVALKLTPLLMVRPGELRAMRWAEVDLDAGEWRFTTSKTGTELVVPLATRAIELLAELHELTGTGVYAFPNPRDRHRCMSENAVRTAMVALGLESREVTAHGFRATARTLLDEVHGIRPDIIEHQLGHSVKDPLGRAYNRTTFLPERVQMMALWADYLESLRTGATVFALEVANG